MAKRILLAGLGFCLLLGTASLWGGEPCPHCESKNGTWVQRLLGRGKSKPAECKHEEKAKAEARVGIETQANQRAMAEQDFLKRKEVLIKLRQIAEGTNDRELLRKVEMLEERAWNMYLQITGIPEKKGESVDQQIFETHLGPSSKNAALDAPMGAILQTALRRADQ